MTVTNNKDLEFLYICLKNNFFNEEITKEAKRAVRAYTNKPISEERVFHADYDRAIYVVPLPDDIGSIDEADKYFDEYMTIDYVPSAYDCTGQAFTAWYKVFERGGRYWAYHYVSRDV